MSSHRFSSADTAWLRMDQPTNLMVITSVTPLPRSCISIWHP